MAKEYLAKHLNPKGNLLDENVLPNVIDDAGNILYYTSVNRKTTDSTLINLGSGPNTNNGDPLRIAFAKINNFMEASYWAYENISDDVESVEDKLDRILAWIDDVTLNTGGDLGALAGDPNLTNDQNLDGGMF